MSIVKIKWENIYYPLGEWQNEEGKEVPLKGNFMATFKGHLVIVIQHKVESGSGHGESSFTATIPTFYSAINLQEIPVGKEFIEVNTDALLPVYETVTVNLANDHKLKSDSVSAKVDVMLAAGNNNGIFAGHFSNELRAEGFGSNATEAIAELRGLIGNTPIDLIIDQDKVKEIDEFIAERKAHHNLR